MSHEDRSTHSPGPKFLVLRDFLRGYLHEDAAVEYGSAKQAALAFRNDADAQQLKELSAEWEQFLELHKTLDSVNKEVAKLGAAWRFEDLKELREIIDALHA